MKPRIFKASQNKDAIALLRLFYFILTRLNVDEYHFANVFFQLHASANKLHNSQTRLEFG